MGLWDRGYVRAASRASRHVTTWLARIAGAAIVGFILLAASPRAPEALKRHLPWRVAAPSSGLAPVQSRSAPLLWPGGNITYYNAAIDQAWAVNKAVEAWNDSGASIHFSPAPRDSAMVTIKHDLAATCESAEAILGRSEHSTVTIWRLDDSSPSCNRFSAALALAHELGHVLGLGHQEQGCATMNKAGSYRGPEGCTPSPPGSWYCRLLQPTDVENAIALYGGEARPIQTATACPFDSWAGGGVS